MDKLKKIISKFSQAKVLVIGDLILDEFIWGTVDRISPEAPVPVVWVNSESYMPGGASNVAGNARALSAEVYIAGTVGSDERAQTLKKALSKDGVNTDGIVTDRKRPTTLKTRIIAHHQQVVRIDREKKDFVSQAVLNKIVSYVKKAIPKVDAVIIEDYGKGVITPPLLREVLKLAKAGKKIVTVDPKEEHFSYYKNVTVITPNVHEASKAAGIPIKDNSSLKAAGQALLKKLKAEAILVTLGEKGMCLFSGSGRMVKIPTAAQDVFDVSGAGDTVISAFSLALASGASMKDAAMISNIAAGIVVGKVGVATVTQKELIKKI